MGCCCKKQAEEQAALPGNRFPGPDNQANANVIGKSSSSGKGSLTKEVLEKKVDQATKTRVLVLRECGLKKLPEETTREGLLTSLRTVDLALNRLQVLPPSIGNWSELQALNASDNLLEMLPDAIGSLTKLQKLTLSRNKLKVLPTCLGDLPLTELKCEGNMLSTLPDVFSGIAATILEELDVSGNRIESLPESVCSLKMLTRLLVNQNRLVVLPLQSIDGCLTRLQHVNAADNSVVEVRPETLRMPGLSELWLKGNPIDRLALQATDGFEEFATRRKQRLDQKIDSKVVGEVDLSMCGL